MTDSFAQADKPQQAADEVESVRRGDLEVRSEW